MQARSGESQQEDMPTLKHFFPHSETNGEILTDTQGGVVWSPLDGDQPIDVSAVVVGEASSNTLQVTNLTKPLGSLLAGEKFTLTEAGIYNGEWTLLSPINDDKMVVVEPVLDGVETGVTYQPSQGFGTLEFGENYVYPKMANQATGISGATRTAGPVPLRAGQWADIPAGGSYMMMYSAMVDCFQPAVGNQSRNTRLAIGDSNSGIAGIGLSSAFHWASVHDTATIRQNTTAADPLDSLDDGEHGEDFYCYGKHDFGVADENKAKDLLTNGATKTFDSDIYSPNGSNPTWITGVTGTPPVHADLGAAQLSQEAFIRSQGLKIYAWAMYIFSGALPADIDYAIRWNAWAWKNGYKIPYPGAVSWT